MLICTCILIITCLSKKIFPTPVVLSLLHVCCMYARGLLHVWPGRYCVITGSWISNPGWKNLTFDVLLIVWFDPENFWSGLEKFNIRCVVDCLILSWVFLNFWSGPGFFDIWCIVDCLNSSCSTTRRRTSLCRRECNTEHSRWRWDLQCEPRTPATAGRRRNDATHSGSQKRHGTVSSSLLVSLSL